MDNKTSTLSWMTHGPVSWSRACRSQEGSFDEVVQAMVDEVSAWNPATRSGMKEFWLMCKPEGLTGKKTVSMRIAFTDETGCEQALTGGIFAFGERLRTCRYRHA